MAMTFQEFKDYVSRTLWRTGDTVFEGDLDVIIRLAESQLDSELDPPEREKSVIISAVDRTLVNPSDFDMLRQLGDDRGSLDYVTPAEMRTLDAAIDATVSGGEPGHAGFPVYTIFGETIRTGRLASVENPVDFALDYHATFPSYETDGELWPQLKYFDLYTNCVLTHCSPYLREDERVQTWQGLYGNLLESAERRIANRRYAGSPLRPRMPSVVA